MRCDKCRYAVRLSDYYDTVEWECHRYPPIYIFHIEKFRFPHVFTYPDGHYENDWCGEFEFIQKVI